MITPLTFLLAGIAIGLWFTFAFRRHRPRSFYTIEPKENSEPVETLHIRSSKLKEGETLLESVWTE